MDAIASLAEFAKGFPPGRGNNVNDSTNTAPSGAKKMAAVGAKKPPGNAGQDDAQPAVAKPGNGKPGAVATPGEDPDAGSVQYATKVKSAETGEFEFVYQGPGERDEDARFVVSAETGEGAHWELPQDSEHYEAFKQWKSARKQGLEGKQIPKELVDGAVKHAERHHHDGGPHKAAYDDHLAHQGEGDGPAPPPTHHSVKDGSGSHPAMQGQPPGKSEEAEDPKKDMIGKLAEFAKPHLPRGKEPKTTGASRNGLEYPATGPVIADAVDDYESMYGLRRSQGADPISALAAFAKGGGHKYTSRKKVGGKWVYEYGAKKGEARHSSAVSDAQQAHREARNSVLAGDKPTSHMDATHEKLGEAYDAFHAGTGDRHPDDPLMDDKIGKSGPGDALSNPDRFVQRGDRYQLCKGLDTYDLSTVPNPGHLDDRLLYKYLAGFVAAAYEHEHREVGHRSSMAGEDMYTRIAQPVMNKLAAYIPRNPHLARAAEKFAVTVDTVASILRQQGMAEPMSDGAMDHGDKWSDDRDSAVVAGVNYVPGPRRESLIASMRPDPLAARGLTLSKGPEMIAFPSIPMSVVHPASPYRLNHAPEREVLVKANFDSRCAQHGDLHKNQIGHHHYTRCSCPG